MIIIGIINGKVMYFEYDLTSHQPPIVGIDVQHKCLICDIVEMVSCVIDVGNLVVGWGVEWYIGTGPIFVVLSFKIPYNHPMSSQVAIRVNDGGY